MPNADQLMRNKTDAWHKALTYNRAAACATAQRKDAASVRGVCKAARAAGAAQADMAAICDKTEAALGPTVCGPGSAKG